MSSIHLGEISSIFLARRGASNELVAVKMYQRDRVMQRAESIRQVLREKHALETAAAVPHPFVVANKFSQLSGEFAVLGMEHVGGGDLFSLLQRTGPLAPEAARFYTYQIVLAVGHLHSFDLMHRDIKPDNVLVALDGYVKLADFSSAKHMTGRVGLDQPPPPDVHTLCGTPEYMAPETLLGAHMYEAVDLWSIGCLAHELLTGDPPFSIDGQSISDLVRRILHDAIALDEHPNIGQLEESLLLGLLRREADERLGTRPVGHTAILDHPWFDGLSTEAVLTKRVPAPWIPHLNGPLPEGAPVRPASPELLAMAARHAQGMHAVVPPAPPSHVAIPAHPFADWSAELDVAIAIAPLAAPADDEEADYDGDQEEEAAEPAVYLAASQAEAAYAEAGAEEDDPALWSSDDDAAADKGGNIDASPDSVLDQDIVAARNSSPAAAGFSRNEKLPGGSTGFGRTRQSALDGMPSPSTRAR